MGWALRLTTNPASRDDAGWLPFRQAHCYASSNANTGADSNVVDGDADGNSDSRADSNPRSVFHLIRIALDPKPASSDA